MKAPVPPGSPQLIRLVAACDAAIARTAAGDGQTFANLGEALFWLCALAEATGKTRESWIRGLAWARNKIAHGVLLMAPVKPPVYGAELGMLVLGRSQLGTISSPARWLHVSEMAFGPHNVPTPNDEKAYEADVAGRPIAVVLNEAQANLR